MQMNLFFYQMCISFLDIYRVRLKQVRFYPYVACSHNFTDRRVGRKTVWLPIWHFTRTERFFDTDLQTSHLFTGDKMADKKADSGLFTVIQNWLKLVFTRSSSILFMLM